MIPGCLYRKFLHISLYFMTYLKKHILVKKMYIYQIVCIENNFNISLCFRTYYFEGVQAKAHWNNCMYQIFRIKLVFLYKEIVSVLKCALKLVIAMLLD